MSTASISRKLVVVGDGYCGKTCLLIAFAKHKFEETYTPTIFETDIATIVVDGRPIELGLWDTAGQEDYDRLRPLSYPDTNVILMIYAVDNRDSISNIKDRWYPEVRHFCPNVPIILVATKSDLRPPMEDAESTDADLFVSVEEGEEMAKFVGAKHFIETSAKKMENINEAFELAARVTMKSHSQTPRRLCPWL